MKKLLKNFIIPNLSEIFRFLIVGTLCFLLAWAVYHICLSLIGLNYLISISISFLISTLVHFYLSTNFTYRFNGPISYRIYFKYLLRIIITYVLTIIVSYIWVGFLNYNEQILIIPTTFINMIFNYIFMKFVVYA